MSLLTVPARAQTPDAPNASAAPQGQSDQPQVDQPPAGNQRAGNPTTASSPAPPAAEMPAPATAVESTDSERRYRELLDRQARLEESIRATSAKGANDGPLAGYSEKNFFLRDADNNFVLIPKGRLNVDYYLFPNRGKLPAGVAPYSSGDQRPKDTLFIRRARLGLAGTFAKLIDFRVEAEFANLPTPGQYATLTDASIVFNSNPYVQLEAGQFYTPFTLENPTSENYTDFMEKGIVTRFAVPTSRDTGVMVLGELPQKIARYWVGLFNGDGQNFKNLDNRAAVIGRAIFSPLALVAGHEKWMQDVWIGGSFWNQTTQNLGGAAAPSTTGSTQGDIPAFTTQAAFTVWSSNYANGVDAAGNAVRAHLAPDGTTQKYAIELNVPVFYRVGVRGEYVYESIDLREYADVNAAGTVSRTSGAAATLSGHGAYGEVYVWLGQDVNVDRPGLYQVPHWHGYVPAPAPAWAVMLAAKYEHVAFDIDALPQATNAAGNLVADAANGHYALDTFELGASLWYTRHTRVMANYVLNYIGAGDSQASSLLKKNLFYRTSEHEILFRWAASL